MLIQHLKFTLRLFLRDKFFFTLNVLGLALGISVGILLLLILHRDLTYDRHHLQHDQIYRLGAHQQTDGDDFQGAITARELGPVLQAEFPEIQRVARVEFWGRTFVKYTDASNHETGFYQDNIVRVDSSFFQVFTHHFLAGNPSVCLASKDAVVLTKSIARKYFGDADPLNRTLVLDAYSYRVTAVIEDVPENSHLRFGILVSDLQERPWFRVSSEAFWNPDVYTYLLVKKGYDPQEFYAKFPAIYAKYFKAIGDQVGGKYTPILEPLAQVHFHSGLQADLPQGNLTYVYTLTGIGCFIILLACINYMNLSTAKSSIRAGEVAIRKTLGSGKRLLSLSFLTESVLLAFVALIVALAMVSLLTQIPAFQQLLGQRLAHDFLVSPWLLICSLGIALSIGLLSGIYPSWVLPSIPVLKALKGAFKSSKASHTFRKTLVTIQFAISIFVVVCTLFMQKQLAFVRSKDLGFTRENILVLPIQDTLMQNQLQALKHELLQHPGIIAVSASQTVPGMANTLSKFSLLAESDAGKKLQGFHIFFVDDEYIKTMGLTLLSGRDFRPGETYERSRAFLANEAAVKVMGWGDHSLGKKIKFFRDEHDGEVVGVVKDFNFYSLHNPIEPALICAVDKELGYIQIRLSGDPSPVLRYIGDRWAMYDAHHPFEYFFLDQRFHEQYQSDEKQHSLVTVLSVICVFVSLLGLVGLSAFAAVQRTKEIGIRKVMGANLIHIILLLSKDVALMVIIAAAVVAPLSRWAASKWLESFAYQMEVDYWIFIPVLIISLALVFCIVLLQSLRTARANPVDSLRQE